MRISELRNKDVINVQDGRRLGYIEDFDLDLERGRIEALRVPAGSGRMFGLFSKGEETVVAWHQIQKIGVDVILIDPEKTHFTPLHSPEPEAGTPGSAALFVPPDNPFREDPFREQEHLFDL